MTLRNFYTTSPTELKIGDCVAVIVTFHVMNITADGKLMLEAYRCEYPHAPLSRDGIPQGTQIYGKLKYLVEYLLPTFINFLARGN